MDKQNQLLRLFKLIQQIDINNKLEDGKFIFKQQTRKVIKNEIDRLSTTHNSDYAVTAGDQPTPKVCPNCGKENEMYFSKDDRWHCNNCQIHGTGQTFA